MKDSLPTNDPAKVIKGAEFSTEFTAIQTAFGQAAPIASPTFTGTATFNNITATGTVTLSSVNVNGTVTADGLTVDTNTLYVDALNNRVGVGTTSPGYRLDVYRDSNDNAPALAIRNPNAGASAASRLYMEADGNNFNIYVNGDGTADANITQFSSTAGGSQFAFETAGSERMRINSSGNLGIGTASPSAKLEVEDDDFARLDLNLSDASGTTIADVRGLVAGSEKWRLGKTSSSSDDFTINVAGSEALRVDTGGDLLVGKASGSTTEEGHKIFGSGQYYMYSTATQVQRYYETSTGNQVGSIAITTAATTYNTSSDARLKENIADAEDAGAKVDAIKVRQFDWKADGSHQDYGMVAQELMTVAPEAVSGDPESDNMMGVDYSKLVPMLVKEIQSLRARVAALEA